MRPVVIKHPLILDDPRNRVNLEIIFIKPEFSEGVDEIRKKYSINPKIKSFS